VPEPFTNCWLLSTSQRKDVPGAWSSGHVRDLRESKVCIARQDDNGDGLCGTAPALAPSFFAQELTRRDAGR
jgi:hypothetical protein